LEREYLEKSVKASAAWRVADRGEEPLDLETVERVEASFIRSDVLNTARAILEDLPESAFGGSDRRWRVVAVLQAAHDAASAAFKSAKQEVGPLQAERR
jgi:hypothetical protein